MNRTFQTGRGLYLAVLATLALVYCGGGGGSAASGTGPTIPTNPVATPSAGPTPEPPLSASCARMAAGSPNAPCQIEPPDFQNDVDDAIRTLQGEQPQLFEDNAVKSIGAYYVGLIKILDRKKLCAVFDGEELGVTNTSAYSEQYHVLTSRQLVRFGPGSYRITCTPSVIPSAQGPLVPPPPGCTLPSSREVACSREEVRSFYDDVEAAIAQIQTDKPALFDFSQTQPGTNWPLLKDLDAYTQGVIDILAKKGYCARSDGEELQVKRGTNGYSEQFKIDYSHKYIRTGAGIYRATCRPAAF